MTCAPPGCQHDCSCCVARVRSNAVPDHQSTIRASRTTLSDTASILVAGRWPCSQRSPQRQRRRVAGHPGRTCDAFDAGWSRTDSSADVKGLTTVRFARSTSRRRQRSRRQRTSWRVCVAAGARRRSVQRSTQLGAVEQRYAGSCAEADRCEGPKDWPDATRGASDCTDTNDGEALLLGAHAG